MSDARRVLRELLPNDTVVIYAGHRRDRRNLGVSHPSTSPTSLNLAGLSHARGGEAMPTTSRKDIDAELAAWLAGVRCDQAGAVLDAYADLYLANDAAKAVKDKRPPTGDPTHEALNVILDRIMGR